MRVFVYEYMTATGTGREPGAPEHSMYLEGRAMRDAVIADLERIPSVEPFAFPDKATPVEQVWFEEVCRFSDWTLVIAPESAEILADFAKSVEHCRGCLLGPSHAAIQLTSDKLLLAEHWRARGIPTPATTDRLPTACDAFPVVWKPRDGAGSTNTFLIRDRFELTQALSSPLSSPMILQECVSGCAASLAFLCGPHAHFPFVPTFQLLSDDGRFKYRGGELPLPQELAQRAIGLASRAMEGIPGLLGYVGVDMVLGKADDGSRDFAIEINPRLTTSYIGLRALADFNIADAMLRIAGGKSFGEWKWKNGRVQFWTDGTIQAF